MRTWNIQIEQLGGEYWMPIAESETITADDAMTAKEIAEEIATNANLVDEGTWRVVVRDTQDSDGRPAYILEMPSGTPIDPTLAYTETIHQPESRKAGRPAVGPKITLNMPADLLGQLTERAEQLDVTRSDLMRRYLESGVRQHLYGYRIDVLTATGWQLGQVEIIEAPSPEDAAETVQFVSSDDIGYCEWRVSIYSHDSLHANPVYVGTNGPAGVPLLDKSFALARAEDLLSELDDYWGDNVWQDIILPCPHVDHDGGNLSDPGTIHMHGGIVISYDERNHCWRIEE